MDWQRFIPGFWMQNEPTDLCWDEALNVALDTHGVSAIGAHTCIVGPFSVWTSNYPYSYGNLEGGFGKLSGLPKVATRRRLKAMVGAKLIEKARVNA